MQIEIQLEIVENRFNPDACFLLMLERSDEDGSEYEDFDEDFTEVFTEDFTEVFDEDSDEDVPRDVFLQALCTLGKLEPATLAQHASFMVARLEETAPLVREMALHTLAKLEPVTYCP